MDYLGAAAQQEQLNAIGTRLSEEREKQSISLEEIAAKTYIPLRLLTAIEKGNMKALPEPVFIQGFIRRYADAIGLDGMAISKEFPVNLSPLPEPVVPEPPTIPAPVVEPPIIPKPEPTIAAKPEPKIEQPIDRSIEVPKAVTSEFQPSTFGESKRSLLPLIGIGAALALGLIAIIASSMNRPQSANQTTQSNIAPAPNSPPPANSPAVSPSPAASPSSDSPVGVKINVTEDSWVLVLVDGEQAFEGTLPKGTQRTWRGKKQVEISSGNAGGVAVSYNNAPFKPMGTAGDVQTVTFPPAAP